jgi:hypothetical protein
VLLQSQRGGKVGAEVELAIECIKDALPFIVAWISELKNDRNMRLNVHCLEDNNGGWFDRRNIVADRQQVGRRVDAGEMLTSKRRFSSMSTMAKERMSSSGNKKTASSGER